ncbi:MAG TPA: hypothetical protein VLC55_08740, partial [Burkholderiales bacterium]|nr:hypothetical protein [Burkholderiales bacterium]
MTNRSYIEKRAFDGFRKAIADEFAEVYVVDLGGDVRDDDAESKGNVFGIKVGIAIGFFVRSAAEKSRAIHLVDWSAGTGEEKLKQRSSSVLNQVKFELLKPDEFGDWRVVDREDFSAYMPLLIPKLSGKKHAGDRRSVFELGTFG